jgi:DNA polymerase-3 subunit delta'
MLLSNPHDPDWRRILKLADTLSGRDSDELFATALDTLQRFLSSEIDRRKGEGAVHLLGLVEASDRISDKAREAAIYNLDRRPLVLSLFTEAAGALRAV